MNVRDLIKRPLGGLKTFESQALPRGAPSISKVLTSIVDALPPGPQLPNLGGLARARGFSFKLPRTAGVFRSVEELLPPMAPKVSSVVERIESVTLGGGGGGAPAMETAPAPKKAPDLVFE